MARNKSNDSLAVTPKVLEDFLPHGSGINQDWHIEDKGSYFRADNSYNASDEMGDYIGWQDFYLTIPKKDPSDFKLHFTGDRRIIARQPELRDYLNDVVMYGLDEMKELKGIQKRVSRQSAVRMMRKAQKLTALTKEQRSMTQDQRSFLASLLMWGAGRKHISVYGYGAGRSISRRELDPLKKRGLITYKNLKQQQASKSLQADVKLTKKGEEYAKQFHF